MRQYVRVALSLVLALSATVLAQAERVRADVPVDQTEPAALVAPGPAAEVGPMRHVWQMWNNCGPASVTMALDALGVDVTQEEARLALRGPDIRVGMPAGNVGPWVSEKFGLRTVWRTGGTADQIKLFVANGFSVLVTQWLEDPPSRIAHYRVVRGYDDARQAFLVNDPMRGANVALGYGWFDENWQAFLYRYLVIYRPEDEPKVRAIVGDDWDDVRMRERMYLRARDDAARDGTSPAWLAYGEAAYQYGLFGEAVAAYERGLVLGSPAGVFTARTSYPHALRLLGRSEEADAALRKLTGITSGPVRTSGPDALAVALAEHRARMAEHYAQRAE